MSHWSQGKLKANPVSVPVYGAKKTLLNVEFPLKRIIGNFLLIRHDFNETEPDQRESRLWRVGRMGEGGGQIEGRHER